MIRYDSTMPRKSYLKCYFGCLPYKGKLHHFPSPEYPYSDKFELWKAVLSEIDKEKGNNNIFNKIRICDCHFEDFYKTAGGRLTKNAVPTLNLAPTKTTSKIQLPSCSSGSANSEQSKLLCEVEATPSKKGMLEVCIDCLESAVNAIHGGADELEVCSSLTEGGLTPSPGLVQQIERMVHNISNGKPIRSMCRDRCSCYTIKKVPKVNVMIRCRTGSDFCYSDEEMDTMLSDIQVFKTFGVDRFVFGALTDTQEIDEINCSKVIEHAGPLPVTFHRAFDVCSDPVNSLQKIIDLGFKRVLTSGQQATASDPRAIQIIKYFLSYNIEVMPGAGVNVENARTFIDIGCKIVHSSCKRVKYLPRVKNALSMGTSDSEHVFVTDEDIVKKMKTVIDVAE